MSGVSVDVYDLMCFEMVNSIVIPLSAVLSLGRK